MHWMKCCFKHIPRRTMQNEASQKQKQPKAKQGKIIVRNLGFDLREKHLKAAFSKFGQIKEINVPVNPAKNTTRGFGFVEFESR